MAEPVSAAGTRRSLNIEAALTWTYRDELPKGYRQRHDREGDGPRLPRSPLLRLLALGTAVDGWTREPGFPLAVGEPHPDALKIEAAVAGLSGAGLVCRPDDYAAELEGLVPACASYGEAALRGVRERVMTFAKLGRGPALSDAPIPGPCTSPVNGKTAVRRLAARSDGVPVATDLPTKAIRRDVYPSGSYCPLVWSPDPREVVRERAEYLAWWLALDWLARELDGLDSIVIAAPASPPRPWADGGEAERVRRILRDLGKPARRQVAGRGDGFGS